MNFNFTRYLIFTLLIIAKSSCIFSQEEEENYVEPDEFKLIIPKHSYNIDFNLPVSLKNTAFKGLMQGLARSGVGYQYNFKKGFSLGLGYQYTFFQINKFKTPQQIHGGLHINAGYFKLGYDKFYNERFGTEIKLKAGYSNFTFYSDSLERINGTKNTNIASLYIEPSIALVLSGSKNTSYKWIFAYSIHQMGFSPPQIGMLADGGYDPNAFKRNIRFLAFGFSFSHYFKQWD